MILGIDIGTRGALAPLNPQGELLEVADMPVLRDGPKGRPAVNAPLLAELIYRWHAKQAFIEFVGARPGEGAVGAFAFGRSRGLSRARSPLAGRRRTKALRAFCGATLERCGKK